MTTHRLLLALLAVLAAHPAAAQYAPRSVALEAGASSALSGAGATAVPVALAASLWLEGDLDALVRVGWESAAEPGGRAADLFSGTAGLRWSATPAPVRLQLAAELGWARDGAGRGGIAAAASAGLEWFLAPEVALGARAGGRFTAGGGRAEAVLRAALYF